MKIEIQLIDEFKTESIIDNDIYFFHARYENKIFPKSIRYGYHLTFGIKNNDKYKITNNNIPFKVFKNIKESFYYFLKKYNPEKISFIVEGDKKEFIYLSIFDTKLYYINKIKSGLESLSGEIPYLIIIDKK